MLWLIFIILMVLWLLAWSRDDAERLPAHIADRRYRGSVDPRDSG